MSFNPIANKPNILILSCLGGSGHESARKTTEIQLESQYNFQVIYPLQHLGINLFIRPENFYNQLIQSGQKKLVNFLASHIPNALTSQSEKVSQVFQDSIQKFNPVLVISLLPLINEIAIRNCDNAKIPFCLVTAPKNLHKPTHTQI